MQGYVLDDPRLESTTLGPVVSLRSAANIRAQIAEAVAQGAKALIDESEFPIAKEGTTYVAPQVLVDVDHSMRVMMEETFGPVMGIMRVKTDEEAVRLINDSPYGLTSSVVSLRCVTTKVVASGELTGVFPSRSQWTKDLAAFDSIVDEIETGTVFMNRCDYLDPALAWTGVKDSGRGVSLSRYGFDAVTRAKSIHVRAL